MNQAVSRIKAKIEEELEQEIAEHDRRYRRGLYAALDIIAEDADRKLSLPLALHHHEDGALVGNCPCCGNLLYREHNHSFCGLCGEELTWEKQAS